MIQQLKERVLSGGVIEKDEALLLSRVADKEALYEAAHEITAMCMDDKFDTCSIVNAKSGNCSEDCKWCAQSARYRTHAAIYPLISEMEIRHQAKEKEQYGSKRFGVVTSGRQITPAELGKICTAFEHIRKETGLKCCASLGLLTKEQLLRLKTSGVETYHCNIETAPSRFSQLCTTHSVEDKVKTLQAAREAGLRICSGGIIGMGETMEQRIEMALFLRNMEVGSIPVNLLQPIDGTPLENAKPLTDEELLTTIALFRFINPKAFLRFAGGKALMKEDTQRKALYIGINASIIGELLTTTASDAEKDKILFASSGYSLERETDWKQ
jgi:biotin synthase